MQLRVQDVSRGDSIEARFANGVDPGDGDTLPEGIPVFMRFPIERRANDQAFPVAPRFTVYFS